ncbi:MAG: hypothetical protein JXM73_23990 [Anaerolineae bacterium]|nr:hypothetical protein [Anaerolineae bacterium]
MAPGEQKRVEIKIRLHPSQDDDLIPWLKQLDHQPYGVKTQAVKGALRRGLGAEREQTSAPPTMPEHPAELSRQSLVEIRQVVEAAVVSALSRFAFTLEGGDRDGGTTTTTEEDDPVEDLLDTLGKALVLDDEP